MYHDVKEQYWWDNMTKSIAEFVAQCPNCQQVKIEHQKPSALIQNIEILTWKWEVINMDFIIGLPCSYHKFDSIWVIVDRLTKFAHFLPVKTTYRAEDYAKLYIKKIVRLHGPDSIHQATEKVKVIQERLRTAQSRQKTYSDIQRRDLEFEVDDWIFLRISPMNGVMHFGKKEFVHPLFHVSMLRKCIGDPYRVVHIKDVQVTEDLSYEKVSVAIFDRQVRKLITKDVASVKVLWRNKNTEEITWEEEKEMKSKYPYIFHIEDNEDAGGTQDAMEAETAI
ncbi:uncharacterized protein [Nicotiana tomentosiformis]|uniref:uncharacterized protein n=1 Tax=Nicotiana tomentosiformis TaxID=4098 RepID=UPI00388CB3B9